MTCNEIIYNSPGVRELFEQEPAPPIKKTRVELMKNIDADYYGYRDDDDDGILIQLEEKAEKVALLKAIEEWNEKRSTEQLNDDDDIYKTDVKVSDSLSLESHSFKILMPKLFVSRMIQITIR